MGGSQRCRIGDVEEFETRQPTTDAWLKVQKFIVIVIAKFITSSPNQR
jgi:hypothetical protein